MADLKEFQRKLLQNLRVLEGKARWDFGESPELHNRIKDHQKAFDLTQQAIEGKLSEAQWAEAIEPLNLSLEGEQEKRPPDVSLETIAKQAGVSRSTVSRVINQQSGVSPETRQRVLDVLAEVGYQPTFDDPSQAEREEKEPFAHLLEQIWRQVQRTIEREKKKPFAHPLRQKKIEEKKDLLNFYLQLAGDLEPARVRGLTRIDPGLSDQFIRLYGDLRFGRYLAPGFNLTPTRAGDRNLNLQLLAYALAGDRDRDRILAFALAHDRDLARAITLAGDPDLRQKLSINRLLTKSIILLLEIAQLQAVPTPPAPLRLTLTDRHTPEAGFSPDYLTTTVMPYLAALTDIQHVVDEIHGRPPTDIKILAIQYGSVTADITGGIRDTVELILDLVVRWRRENKKRLADLEAAQKEVEIKQKEIEVEQARVAMDSDAEQAADKARLAKAQADELELKNQQLQLELMKLTLEIVEQVKPDLPGEQKLLYAMKMVDSTRLIAMSPLELVDVEEIEAEPVGPAEAESKEDEAGQDDNEKDS